MLMTQIVNYLNIKCKLNNDQIDEINKCAESIHQHSPSIGLYIIKSSDSSDLPKIQLTWDDLDNWDDIVGILELINYLMDVIKPIDKKSPVPIYEMGNYDNINFKTNITIDIEIQNDNDDNNYDKEYKFIKNFINQHYTDNKKINMEINKDGISLFVKDANIFTMIDLHIQLTKLNDTKELFGLHVNITTFNDSLEPNEYTLN